MKKLQVHVDIAVPEGREYGCDRCRDSPGFIETVVGLSLHSRAQAEKSLELDTFCTCETGHNLHRRTAKEAEVAIDQAYMERLRSKALCEARDIYFRGWEYPRNLEGMTMKSWVSKFGSDPNKFHLMKAMQSHWEHGEVQTERGSWAGILALGNSGTGKTGCLTPLLRHYEKEGRPVLWISLSDILFMTNWIDDKKMIADRMRILKTIPYLMIDEFVHPSATRGMGEQITDHERTKIIYPIIDARHRKNLATFMTSNCSQAEIEAAIGSMSWSRLQELCAIVSVTGESGRKEVGYAYPEQDKMTA